MVSDSVPPMESPAAPPPSPTFVWVAVLMGVLVLAVQGLLLFLVLDTRTSVGDVSDDLRNVELRLAGGLLTDPDQPVPSPTVETAPPATTAPLDTPPPTTAAPGTTLPSPLANLPSSPAPELAADAAGLPTLASNTDVDPAVGMQLGDLGAVEWGLGDELVVDLADGTARAIVVFAHWCPSCQELLPDLAAWQDSTGAALENMELLTVASATEEESDTTLPDYLSDAEFPFPVLVDSTNELAARLGVNAFPFWVFVSPEGQVIGRLAGQLTPEQFEALFSDLDEVGAPGS